MHNSFQVSNSYKSNEPLLYSYLPEEEAVKVKFNQVKEIFFHHSYIGFDDERDVFENNEEEANISEQDEGEVVLDEASLVVSESH